MAYGLLSVSAMAAVTDYPQEFRNGKTQLAEFSGGTLLVLQEDGSLWVMGIIDMLGANGPYDRKIKEDFGDRIHYYAETPKKIAENVVSFECGGLGIGILKGDNSLWVSDREKGTFTKKLDHVMQMSVSSHILAVQEDGTLWAWGGDEQGALGIGDRVPNPSGRDEWEKYYTDQPIKIMENVTQIDTGDFSIVLKEDGSVWCWGVNDRGQIGTGKIPNTTGVTVSGDYQGISFEVGVSEAYERTPVKVMEDVKNVFALWDCSAALKNDNSLWVWGNCPSEWEHLRGQPTPVKLAEDVKDVLASNGWSMLVIKNDNTLWNYDHHKGTQKLMDNIAAAYKGTDSIVALRIDGTVWDINWSSDTVDIAQHQGNMDQVVYIDEGIAIKENGSLFVDGNNQIGVGVIISDALNVGEPEFISIPIQLTGPANTPLKSAPTAPQATEKSSFSDVAAGAYYYDAVQWAVSRQITAGTTATTFSPNTTCTNGQILTFLWRAKGQPEPTISNPFTDVTENAYYYKAALWAYQNGMVSGASLGADMPCTRSQTVTYLWKLAGQPAAASASAFADVDGGAEYAQAVSWAVGQGITSGTSATTFAPDGTCTRGQIVTFLYRDMGK